MVNLCSEIVSSPFNKGKESFNLTIIRKRDILMKTMMFDLYPISHIKPNIKKKDLNNEY